MENNTFSESVPHPILALYDAGFGEDLIPIIPPDASLSPRSKVPIDQRGKAPGKLGPQGWHGFNWRKSQATREIVAAWIADGAGFGLRTRRFPTIDVDVLDPTLSSAIEEVLSAQLGTGNSILKRVGQAPKFAVPCHSEQPFGKMKWVLRHEDEKDWGAIEILGDGQQFVIDGIHSKTRKPYTWSNGEMTAGAELLAAPGSGGLPALSRIDLLEKVLPALEERLSSVGIRLERSGNGRAIASGSTPNQETLRAPSIAELRAAVTAIPNDDQWDTRDEYISMGFAIKAAAGPDHEAEGLETFLEWTDRWTDGTNDPDQVRADWKSMKAPFRRGWSWVAERARAFGYNDAANHFEVAPDSAPPVLPPPPEDSKYTEMGNAGRFARRYRHELRHVAGLGWLVYDGRQWATDSGGAKVTRMAKQVVREMWVEATGIEDKDVRDALVSHARRSEAERPLRAMVSLAASELTIPLGALNPDPWLINVSNGVVDLREGILRAHDPSLHLTKLAPAAFKPEAVAPTWLAFLDRVFQGDRELIAFVQRAVGYSLTGLTDEQVFFLLHGTGANGKSTFLEALREVSGEYAAQAEFSTFLTRAAGGPRNDIARLHGARLVAAAEAEAGEHLAEATVKQLTGGDMITARFLYKEHFEFRPHFKIWLAANHKPAISGSDHAIWRRILLIPFLVTIPDQERDPRLVEKLKAERDGILRWAVEGCLSWQQHGLKRPSAVLEATQGYRAEMDWLAAFVQERCVVAPRVQVRTAELYETYMAWCPERGELPQTRKVFNERLAAYDPGRVRKHKTGGYDFWLGLEVRAEPITPPVQELTPSLEALPV